MTDRNCKNPAQDDDSTQGGGSKGFRFSRTINIADILALISLALTGIFFFTNVDRRLAVLEDGRIAQIKINEEQNVRIKELAVEMRSELKDIGIKLDRIREMQVEQSKGK